MINQNFAKEDAEIIRNIPFPRTPQEDMVIWHYDKKGIYSVKSGYQLALKIKFSESLTGSTGAPQGWQHIWRLNLPEKIKIFVWKAAKNLLPTAKNLWRRKVLKEPTCHLCKAGCEDVFHALMECRVARRIWKCTHLENEVKSVIREDMLSVMIGAMNNWAKSEVDYVATIWWVAWHARNKLLFQGKKLDPVGSVARGKVVMEVYQAQQVKERESHGNTVEGNMQIWTPPPNNKVKVNVDAAVKEDRKSAGLGVVIRNHRGQVLAAAVKSMNFQGNAAIAEAHAVKWGMEVAKDLSLSNVIIDTDCKNVADLANKKVSNRTEIWWTMSDIYKNTQDFQLISFQHVPRKCNGFAHFFS